ncbi:hypothetical protein IWT140_01564 [Secundilactobacillus pentosiphilus]|uniref:Uncharacterized protein n=1 Tax=Secundilactobacillus pentosiphilus TaxID=1714682 RepID=A0A1Z5IQC5_9LACO|nr:hypothetical protein [Secundilactobacillus pentosiphilus]GAX03930.1 hypothetical protein IWT140_01564 [Secundilactobacillus pentosiphilus]
MRDQFNEFSVAQLIAMIEASQRRLQLTNRAIMDLMGLDSEKEDCFFSGKTNRITYARTAKTLQMIERLLAGLDIPLTAYLQQLRALPLHNVFLRNRYAFWFANFIDAGGLEPCLVADAKEYGFEIIKQIVWSSNLLTSTAGIAHLKTHQKQLVQLSENEYQTIKAVMTHFSTASPLFFYNLDQLFSEQQILELPDLAKYWDQEAALVNIE